MKVISTNKAPAAIGPYSQAIVTGGYVFTSGQIPIDPATGEVAGDCIVCQAEQVMANLKEVLEAAGASFESAVKTTCFLADMADFTAFNSVYEKYFVNKPARSCVAVKTLPKGVKVEVEVIAEIGERKIPSGKFRRNFFTLRVCGMGRLYFSPALCGRV